MTRFKKICLCAAVPVVMLTAPAFALVGIGVHYGADFTLSMKNTQGLGEHVSFDSLKLNLGPNAGNTILIGQDIPAYVTRSNFKSDFAFGGKIYIDVIPIIDAVEVSADFGIWDYIGQIKYPNGIINLGAANLADPNNFTYDSTKLTLNNFGLGYFGLANTPYAKLQLDATIRKYIIQFPKPLKTLRLYGGAGLTVNFATPVLSSNLVQSVINESAQGQFDLSAGSTNLGTGLLNNDAIMKAVVQKIIAGLTQPSYGAHIDLGVMVKIPIIPIGVYVDGKFMIPFGELDKYVKLGGMGVLLNGGVALAF
ncbi:MAG TPA: hypothetical protein VLX68_04960 [Chitinivibrionales bacterium]|nr:hypothetical protein [Chitinivibrionales bacterium]